MLILLGLLMIFKKKLLIQTRIKRNNKKDKLLELLLGINLKLLRLIFGLSKLRCFLI